MVFYLGKVCLRLLTSSSFILAGQTSVLKSSPNYLLELRALLHFRVFFNTKHIKSWAYTVFGLFEAGVWKCDLALTSNLYLGCMQSFHGARQCLSSYAFIIFRIYLSTIKNISCRFLICKCVFLPVAVKPFQDSASLSKALRSLVWAPFSGSSLKTEWNSESNFQQRLVFVVLICNPSTTSMKSIRCFLNFLLLPGTCRQGDWYSGAGSKYK